MDGVAMCVCVYTTSTSYSARGVTHPIRFDCMRSVQYLGSTKWMELWKGNTVDSSYVNGFISYSSVRWHGDVIRCSMILYPLNSHCWDIRITFCVVLLAKIKKKNVTRKYLVVYVKSVFDKIEKIYLSSINHRGVEINVCLPSNQILKS